MTSLDSVHTEPIQESEEDKQDDEEEDLEALADAFTEEYF